MIREFLRPARVERSLQITTTAAALSVTVTAPSKTYVGTYIPITVSWSPVTGPALLTIDFGDGTGETPPPILPTAGGKYTTNHSYASSGTKTVKATVKDDVTQATGTGQATVQVADVLVVTFTADKTSGNVPLTVTFSIGISGGFTPYSYTLDPGDGSTPYTGTAATPGTYTQAHTYTKTGTYTAKVTVDDALGAVATQTLGIGAGVPIFFPRLREKFPRFFEFVDKWRQRIRERVPYPEEG